MRLLPARICYNFDGFCFCISPFKQRLFFGSDQNRDEAEEAVDHRLADMDGINESIDLENSPQNNDSENTNDDNDNGHKTDDECASEAGSSRRSEPVDYTKSTEFKELQDEVNRNLLSAVRMQLKNTSALVRKVVMLMLDFLGTTNRNIDQLLISYVSCDLFIARQFIQFPKFIISFKWIYFVFHQELRQLFIDQSPLVRRQLVLSLDKILNSRPSNEAAISAYVKIILDLANDIDQKVMETVVESFKRNIFDKIEVYEQSPSLSHVFPWRLLKCMLNCQDSPDFRISVQKWMNQNLIKYDV